jgi:hypothetical protein
MSSEQTKNAVRQYLDGKLTREQFGVALEKAAPNAVRALPTNQEEIKELSDTICAIMKAAHDKYSERVTKLEERVLGLEADLTQVRNKAMTFRGAFTDGDFYRPGETVRHAGSLFVAKSATMRTPGSDPAWVLLTGTNGTP